MKYIVDESLSNFEFWSGAVDRAAKLTDAQMEIVEERLCECKPDEIWCDVEINDFFWFEFDTVCQWLGYRNEESFDADCSLEDEDEAEDWSGYEVTDDEKLSEMGLSPSNFAFDDYDDDCSLDSDKLDDQWHDYWKNLPTIERVKVWKKYRQA